MSQQKSLTCEDLQREINSYNEQLESLNSQRQELKTKLSRTDNKRNVAQKLLDTFQAENTQLREKLQSINLKGEQAKEENYKNQRKALDDIKREIEKFSVPLKMEKENYELVQQRIDFAKQYWSKKYTEINRELAEEKIKIQMYKAKSAEIHKRIVAYKDYLAKLGKSLPSDSKQDVIDTIKENQNKIEKLNSEQRERRRKLEDECRSLQEKKKILTKQLIKIEE